MAVHDVTEAAIYERTLLESNMRDSLTGVYNRRHFEDRLRQEFKRCTRGSGVFSLIMLDIDHFKVVNDTYGHQCGDFILKSITSTMTATIRDTDVFARYGGEEFACLLPETGIEGAVHVAEGFRRAVRDQTFDFQGNPIKVTISLGAARLTERMATPEGLLQKADDALYEAKGAGRDRVVASR